ncbi:hypothetical protein PAHAL_9G244000 [Panicum hallii]|uniref:Secreted protein n=1 Tax=Panicum hallii TaxID=206008 RepID=A0A2T8I2D7_9POAL|nr:hypothetical protein PAHAL_9G244000 [Panicum hallii]
MSRGALCWNFCFLCRVSLIPCVCNACSVVPPSFFITSLFFFCLVLDIIPMVFSDYNAVLQPEVQLGLTTGQSRKKCVLLQYG